MPSHDEAIYERLKGVVSDIEKIRTAINPPYEANKEFAEFEEYYISAFSKLDSAQAAAENRADIYRGRMSERSAEIVAIAIGNCNSALKKFAIEHKRKPVSQDDFEESQILQNCTISKMLEERLDK